MRSLTVGGIDVNNTIGADAQGAVFASVFIPGLPSGDYTIEADIGGDLVAVNFTITDPDCDLATGTSNPTITLSPNSGPQHGYYPEIHSVGFPGYMPISRFVAGSLDFGSSYFLTTYCGGEVQLPGNISSLPVGKHTLEVEVAGSTASADFTITPPLTVTLSAYSGPPGSIVTLRGERFQPLVPVGAWACCKLGTLVHYDVSPSPPPSTDAHGTVEFDIRIPDLEPGHIGHISVGMQADGSVASADFTVTAPPPTPTPSPTPTPTPRPAATPTPAPTTAPPQLPGGSEPPHIFTGQATLNGSPAGQGIAIDAYDGGRLIGATVTQSGGRYTIHVHRSQGIITFRVNQQAAAESWTTWQQGQVTPGFNLTAAGVSSSESDPTRLFAALPDLVRAFAFDNATKQWDFFDPVVPEVSTLTRFVPGSIYWLLVSHTTRLMLNGVEHDLSCVGDDCWNLIVW